jgi:hypothetical protein
MRTHSDSDRDDTLLDALLQDEDWQAASAACKAAALRTLCVRQRIRRLTRWTGSVAALAAVIAAVAHWFGPRPLAPQPVLVAHIQAPKTPAKPRQLTDTELVAAFPKGSCFIAEVDGEKQLIFFDPKLARTYVAQPGLRGN